jgi:hypothetical protein
MNGFLATRLGRALPVLLIAALVLPSVVWIFADQRVWPWDPGYYGYWTMQAVEAMSRGWDAWFNVNLHALQMMPPLITWLGQFFVPLRHLTGTLETALLMQIVVMTVGTLIVVYRTATRFTATQAQGTAVGLAAIAVCGGAPLFIGLSHHFLTEISQCLAAALSVAVAWRVERRSSARNVAYIVLMVAFAFLSKASSAVFVLPALTYIGVALFITRGGIRAPREPADTWLLIAAVAVSGLTAAWYIANWQVMATHFVQASLGEEVQKYWSGGTLWTKLSYWLLALADGFAFTRVVPLVLAGAATFIVGRAIYNLRAAPRLLHAAVTGGVLFALYLAGTIVAVVVAYALQINEDPRYIVALVPIAALLVAWMLAAMKGTAPAFVVTGIFIVNAAMTHACSFGVQLPGRYSWIWIVDTSRVERDALSRVLEATCKAGEAHAVALGISYPWINGNAANFYAGKRRLSEPANCVYHFMPQDSMENALAWMEGTKIRYLVTVPPAQQDPVNFANVLAKPIAEYAASSPDFALTQTVDRYRIYRRGPPGN